MNPRLLAALAAQRHEELRHAVLGVRHEPARPGLRSRLALRRKVRRSLGWVLVEIGLKLAVDRGTGPGT
jgi:hypothetical protein